MIYQFTDQPNIKRRSPVKRAAWAIAHADKKRQQMLDTYTVEELIAMGFYSHESKPLPHGIEIWSRKCQISDKHPERPTWQEISVPTLALCLPYIGHLSRAEKIFKDQYWAECQTYYYGFRQQSSSVVLYCILDLLNRLINLTHWDKYESIPLNWRIANPKALEFAMRHIAKINEGTFSLQPPTLKPEWLKYSVTKIRHEYTPYDYEWETSKRSRDEAHEYWNAKIINQKSIKLGN